MEFQKEASNSEKHSANCRTMREMRLPEMKCYTYTCICVGISMERGYWNIFEKDVHHRVISFVE